jgi:hypothetical protein
LCPAVSPVVFKIELCQLFENFTAETEFYSIATWTVDASWGDPAPDAEYGSMIKDCFLIFRKENNSRWMSLSTPAQQNDPLSRLS